MVRAGSLKPSRSNLIFRIILYLYLLYLIGKQLNKHKKQTMKKVLFVFAIATALVACGGASTEATTTDSTAVDSTKVDTTAVIADTTAKVDSIAK